MNKIRISGVYGTKNQLGKNLYKTILSSKRKSGVTDDVNVVFSDVLANAINGYDKILVEGEIRRRRTYDNNEEKKYEIYIMADKITPYYQDEDVNDCELHGYMPDDVLNRTTKTYGTVCDAAIHVNRTNATDIIPVIAFNATASKLNGLKGGMVSILGRLQSREYKKANRLFVAHEVATYAIRKEKDNNNGI